MRSTILVSFSDQASSDWVTNIVYKVQDDLNAIPFGIADHSIESWDAVRRIVDVASCRIQELEEDRPRPRICIDASESPDPDHLKLGVLNLREHKVHIGVDHKVTCPPGVGASEILGTSTIVIEEPRVNIIDTRKRRTRSTDGIRWRCGVCRARIACG